MAERFTSRDLSTPVAPTAHIPLPDDLAALLTGPEPAAGPDLTLTAGPKYLYKHLGRMENRVMWDDVAHRAMRLRALVVGRTETSRAPHCGQHRPAWMKPNAYECVCGNVRLLHWQNTPCPRGGACGLTRAESIVKAAAAHDRKTALQSAAAQVYGQR